MLIFTCKICCYTQKYAAATNCCCQVSVWHESCLSEKCKTEIGSSRDSKLEFPVSNKCLRFFIKFVYEGPSKCELSEDILLEVIEMSNYFEIVELQELWRNFIESHVNEDNCFEFLAMSQFQFFFTKLLI